MKGFKIGIIGTGRVGGNLAIWLKRSGFNLAGVYDINPNRAEKIARLSASANFQSLESIVNKVNILMVAVPDDNLPSLSSELYSLMPFRARYIVHTSGIYSANIFRPLAQSVSAVSLHPPKAIPSVNVKANPFKDALFVAEGDKPALTIVRRIVRGLGATLIETEINSRGLYHAGCCFVSNLLMVNLMAGSRLLRESGLSYKNTKKVMRSLIESVVESFINSGSITVLTGPLARGDLSTLERHRLALRGREELKLYESLVDYLSKLLKGSKK